METETAQHSKGMRIAAMIVRYLLGLIFFVFGLNGFLNFLPSPPMEGAMLTFVNGMLATVYFLPMLKLFQILAGLLLLSGFYVPLALVILAPITLNIFLVHVSIAPEGLPIAIFVLAANIFLVLFYRKNFKGIFSAE